MSPKKDRLPDSVHITIKKISDKICDSADNIQFMTVRKDVITNALIDVYWRIKPYTLRDKLNTLYRSMEKIFLQAHIRYSKTHLMYCMDRNRDNLRNLRSDTAYSRTSVWPILLNDIDFILEPDLLNEIAEAICKARFNCDTDRETAYDLILQSIFNIERKLYIYVPIQSFTIERTNMTLGIITSLLDNICELCNIDVLDELYETMPDILRNSYADIQGIDFWQTNHCSPEWKIIYDNIERILRK